MKPFITNRWVWTVRGIALTSATYIYFLIFAQFAFLRLVKAHGLDFGSIRLIMGSMALAGLLGSLAAARIVRNTNVRELLLASLGGCAAAAGLALTAASTPAFMGIAVVIGGSLAVATVSLAGCLPQLLPPTHLGLSLGLGTGAAYAICNLPVIFGGSPALQSCLAIGACLIGALAVLGRPLPGRTTVSTETRVSFTGPFFALIGVFLALVWLDSAAFLILQATPALNQYGWASAALQSSNAVIHLGAALVAGYWLDRGGLIWILGAAFVALAAAAGLVSANSSLAHMMHWFYATGVSLYSTALVFAPLSGPPAPDCEPVARRAGALYGIAGWCGSTLGIGMAQDLHTIPKWFIAVAGVAIFILLIMYRRWPWRAVLPVVAGGLALGAMVLSTSAFSSAARIITSEGAEPASTVAHGREVYISEGCIHCHSQYIRSGTREEVWWGPASAPDQVLRERPPLIGNRRQGPDLRNIGNRRSPAWNRLHLIDPRSISPDSRMPSYAYLFRGDSQRGDALLAYLSTLGAATLEERYEVRAAWTPEAARAPISTACAGPLFQRNCAACHGYSGAGDGELAPQLGARAPRDLTKGQWQFIPLRKTPEERLVEIARVIKFGIPATSMPGHETMSDPDVLGLARFVDSLKSPTKSL